MRISITNIEISSSGSDEDAQRALQLAAGLLGSLFAPVREPPRLEEFPPEQ